jgi:hypothetical protein
MSPGGYAAHLASLKAAHTTPSQAPADHLRLFASSSDVVLAHRDKITAGVPGCSCGKSYPEGSYSYSAALHAQHVADEVVSHVLDAAVAAVHADLEDFARNPDRWDSGDHDSMAAIDVINKMACRESEQARQKETTTA